MPQIDLLIFDCDGVLIDSEILSSRSLAEAFRAAGVDLSDAESHRLFTGTSQPELAVIARTRWGIEDAQPIIADMHARLFPNFRAHLQEMEGISDLLAEFAHKKCVASNSSSDRLKNSLGLLPIAAHFEGHIYSADMVAKGKPAPDLPLLCLKEMNTAPENAVFIDDSSHGITAAIAAGIFPIGFVDLKDPREGRVEALKAAGAVYVACGHTELAEILRGLTA